APGHRVRRAPGGLSVAPSSAALPGYSAAADSAGRICMAASRFGPHRVRMTLPQDSTPSSTIEDAASTKKFAAVAAWVDRYQPPTAMKSSRPLCASTGPTTLAAPCEE